MKKSLIVILASMMLVGMVYAQNLIRLGTQQIVVDGSAAMSFTVPANTVEAWVSVTGGGPLRLLDSGTNPTGTKGLIFYMGDSFTLISLNDVSRTVMTRDASASVVTVDVIYYGRP